MLTGDLVFRYNSLFSIYNVVKILEYLKISLLQNLHFYFNSYRLKLNLTQLYYLKIIRRKFTGREILKLKTASCILGSSNITNT